MSNSKHNSRTRRTMPTIKFDTDDPLLIARTEVELSHHPRLGTRHPRSWEANSSMKCRIISASRTWMWSFDSAA
eukprot:2417151-Rhodomonas_salina.1